MSEQEMRPLRRFDDVELHYEPTQHNPNILRSREVFVDYWAAFYRKHDEAKRLNQVCAVHQDADGHYHIITSPRLTLKVEADQ